MMPCVFRMRRCASARPTICTPRSVSSRLLIPVAADAEDVAGPVAQPVVATARRRPDPVKVARRQSPDPVHRGHLALQVPAGRPGQLRLRALHRPDSLRMAAEAAATVATAMPADATEGLACRLKR